MAQYGVAFTAHVTAYDSTAGTMKTGDAANIILYWDKDGTNSIVATASGVPTEVSSTNSPGLYKIAMTAAEATCTTGRLSGKSSTGTNIIISGPEYHFDSWSSVIPAGGIKALGHVDAGTFQSGSGTTGVLRSAASFGDNTLAGHTAQITTNTGVGQSRIVTANVGSTDTITVDTWTAPDNTSDYIIWPSAPGSATAPATANVTQWNNTTVATPATAGIPDVNAKNINNVATTSVTTINANQGTTQPLNFTGTGASATVKGDVTNIATAAVSTSTAQIGVNVVSGTGSYGVKKNTAKAKFPFLMTDSTTHAPATGLTVTATRSLDGAAFGACANAVAELANGVYLIDLAAADLNGNTVCLKFAATGADQQTITIITSP